MEIINLYNFIKTELPNIQNIKEKSQNNIIIKKRNFYKRIHRAEEKNLKNFHFTPFLSNYFNFCIIENFINEDKIIINQEVYKILYEYITSSKFINLQKNNEIKEKNLCLKK